VSLQRSWASTMNSTSPPRWRTKAGSAASSDRPFFDDQDECIAPVDERTLVFKIRNGGNFDFDERKRLSTGGLTRMP
jgi:hypothetical protein